MTKPKMTKRLLRGRSEKMTKEMTKRVGGSEIAEIVMTSFRNGPLCKTYFQRISVVFLVK